MAPKSKGPDYGVDAPALARIVILLVVAGAVIGFLLHRSSLEAARIIASILFSFVQAGLFAVVLSVIYVKVEKFRHRDRMLALLPWMGAEQVLDVGTGRGLLLIGAAKRLTTGRSFGIDIWNQADLNHNSEAATLRNAELEGVRDKVEIRNANAQQIPFAEDSFDYIISNLCLHNIDNKEGRARACREIVRVLRPGGVALISDFLHTGEYAEEFRRQGLEVACSASFLLAPFLLRIIRAQKK